MKRLPITPFTITKVDTITTLSINKIDIDLNTSATISFTFFNDQGQPAKSGWIKLEGEDYQNWTNDDSYIITKILENNSKG